MSYFDDLWDDTRDFFSDDLPEWFKDEVRDEIFNMSVKFMRLKWQVLCIRTVNKVEERMISETKATIAALGLPLTPEQSAALEKKLRELYWKPINLIKKATDAQWLVDTEPDT